MTRALPALLLVLALAACGGGDDPTVAAPSAPAPAPAVTQPEAPASEPAPVAEGAVVLRGDGLVLDGTAFAFGTATQEQVRPALEAALGGVEEQSVPCPAGPRTALGGRGLDVLFDGDTMVGWDESGGTAATESGLRLGATRADVEAALPDAEFTESTLGPEFLHPSGLGGFLEGTEPTSVLVGLTGGEQCVQR